MGGGEWIEKRQELRQESLNQAYLVKKPELTAAVEVDNKPDAFDKVYVGLRSVFPDWLILSFMLVGAITIGLAMFKKQVKSLIVVWGRILDEEKK